MYILKSSNLLKQKALLSVLQECEIYVDGYILILTRTKHCRSLKLCTEVSNFLESISLLGLTFKEAFGET